MCVTLFICNSEEILTSYLTLPNRLSAHWINCNLPNNISRALYFSNLRNFPVASKDARSETRAEFWSCLYYIKQIVSYRARWDGSRA